MKEIETILLPMLQMLDDLKPLSIDLKNQLIKSFQGAAVKKGNLILHEGDVCKTLWFLSEGLLRSYHNIGDKEITSRIMFTSHIVISAGSFFTQTPATESIEALSDSILATLSFDDLQVIYRKFPEFNFHTRIITEQYFAKQEQRLYMLRKHDALSKYKFFIDHYAFYLRDIPQKLIASFLNITPETLSRTRNKLRN